MLAVTGTVVIALVVPETRGKTEQEMREVFHASNSSKFSYERDKSKEQSEAASENERIIEV